MKSFDPKNFTAPDAKPLPVILLLDCSGSMTGEKIQSLNDATRDMLEVFRGTENGETEIHVAIISFGTEVSLHQELTSAGDIQWQDLSAGGGTPLGVALQMAKAMIEDKDVVPSRAYRPTVVLISDGHPTDSWESPLQAFISEGRSQKCDRMAMAIGANADEGVLGRFIDDAQNPLFYSENAKQMKDFFKFVTMSVTSRTQSQTPNALPEPNSIDVQPATIEARSISVQTNSKQEQPTGENAEDEQASEEGYW
jgi:uncharacterized protein YegL